MLCMQSGLYVPLYMHVQLRSFLFVSATACTGAFIVVVAVVQMAVFFAQVNCLLHLRQDKVFLMSLGAISTCNNLFIEFDTPGIHISAILLNTTELNYSAKVDSIIYHLRNAVAFAPEVFVWLVASLLVPMRHRMNEAAHALVPVCTLTHALVFQ